MKKRWNAIGILAVALTSTSAMGEPTPFEQAQARVQAQEKEVLAMDDSKKPAQVSKEVVGKSAAGETQTTTIDETGKVIVK